MGVVADLVASLRLKPDMASWRLGDRLINGIKLAASSLTAGISINAIRGLIDSTLELGGHLSDTSQKLGVSAEALQTFGFAAQQSGSDMGGLEMGFIGLARALDAARGGSKEARKSFQQLGLDWRVLAKQKPEDQFMAIADAIAELPDGSKKTALAMQVLGKSGADLIPTLNLGADGLAAMADEARRTGGVLSNETVASLDTAGDQLDILKKVIAGVGSQLVVRLLPSINAAIEAVGGFISQNYELIGGALDAFISGVTGAFKVLAAAVEFVTDLFGQFGDSSEVLEAAATGLGVAMVGAAVAAGAAWVTALAPFLAVAAAVAGIILVVKALRRNWDGITTSIRSALGRARDAVVSFKDRIVSDFSSMASAIAAPFLWVKDRVIDPIIDKVQEIIDKIQEVADWVRDKAGRVWDFITANPLEEVKKRLEDQARAQSGVAPPSVVDVARNGFAPSTAVMDSLTGRGAAAPGARTVQVSAPVEINVTTQPGQDNAAIGQVVRDQFQQHVSTMFRQAAAGIAK